MWIIPPGGKTPGSRGAADAAKQLGKTLKVFLTMILQMALGRLANDPRTGLNIPTRVNDTLTKGTVAPKIPRAEKITWEKEAINCLV